MGTTTGSFGCKKRWLEKLKALNPWILIGVLSIGIAIVLSCTKVLEVRGYS